MKNTILNNLRRILFYSAAAFALAACTSKMEMSFPTGPDGPDGQSSYEVWVDAVNDGTVDWPKDRTDPNNYLLFLKGKDGKNGADGKSAYELWLTEVEKGVENPHKPGTNWPTDEIEMNDFYLFLSGAPGQVGVTPSIGVNGNWWVGDKDLGVPVDGKDGSDGAAPNIKINSDGYWVINGNTTTVLANGKDGSDGTSAYDLWKAELAAGNLPVKDGEAWPQDKNSPANFWEYLAGKDGKDGTDSVMQPSPQLGYYNVIAQYSNSSNSEFVNWEDGSVVYAVYGPTTNILGAGVKVRLRGVKDPSQEYTTNGNGLITIPKGQLPTLGSSNIFVRSLVYVDAAGDGNYQWTDTWDNTYIPYRMQVRLTISSAYFNPSIITAGVPFLYVDFSVESKANSNADWIRIPSYVGDTDITPIVKNVAQDGTVGTQLTVNQLDGITTLDVSDATSSKLRIRRKVANSALVDVSTILLPVYVWSGDLNQKNYFTLSFDEKCYGESLSTSTLVEERPCQPLPLPETLTITPEEGGVTYLMSLGYASNVATQITPELLYQQNYKENTAVSVPGFDKCLSPVSLNLTAAAVVKKSFLTFRFNSSTTESENIRNNTDPGSPSGVTTVDHVVLPTILSFYATNNGNENLVWNFYGYGIGTISMTGTSSAVITPASGVTVLPTVIVK